MKTLRCLLFLYVMLTARTAYAQADSTFIGHANTALAKQLPIEKVYLHLDKPAYNFADTIWYKAYTVIGQHHQLSALSGVLYVELISPNDTLISRQTVKLSSGTAAGDIPLAATLQQGVYRIRAYTKWMRNEGPAYFYDHKIRIGGILAPSAAAGKQIAPKPDIQFFPEGGDLVVGIRSRVAIKAINGNGLGEDIKGVIEDNAGNVVADFATQHLGMGVFAIIPQGGMTYRAKIVMPGESTYTVDLPAAKEQGYTLAVNNANPDSLFIKVAVNDRLLKEKQGSTFYLLAQSAGKMYYSAMAVVNKPVFGASINKSRFPSGILQVTLFDDRNQPVAERIAFIQGSDSLTLKLSAASGVYKTRQPVKFSLDAAASGQPANGTFSVAVINETVTGADDATESTILNNLLLASDLKGNIEQPNYYFSSTSQAKADLDVLMLTQGYRKFEWKQALEEEPAAAIFQPENSLELVGTVQTMGGKPVPNGKVVLTAPRENIIIDTLTDINGNFRFSNLDMTDTSKVTLNAKQGNNKNNVKITVINPGYAEIQKTNITDTTTMLYATPVDAVLKQKYDDYLQTQKAELFRLGRVLKEVRIKDNRPKKPDLSRSSNLLGGGNADQVIMGDVLANGCIVVTDCLAGKIMGVTFTQRGVPVNFRTGRTMSIIIDGNVLDGSSINDINANDVYSIEVLRSGAARSIYGTSIDRGGAIIITMKNGSERRPDNRTFTGVITYPFKGFTPSRAFYSPKYSAATPLPDTRSTVYWNPDIITDAQGNATFEYLNNDSKGTYRVVIEGIDTDGNLGRQVYRYQVQ